MKFNCGPSRPETQTEKLEKFKQWKRVFAIFPVRLSETECRWMEWVERSYPDAWIAYGSWNLYKDRPKYRTIT